MKCPKCGDAIETKEPYSACTSCGYLALRASAAPKPSRVRERVTREGLYLSIDGRNTALGAFMLGALILSFSVFAWLISQDPQMRRMPEMLKEMAREESIILLIPLMSGLLCYVAALYFTLTMMVNRKTLSMEKGFLTRSAAPLPPLEIPCRIPLDDIRSLEIEYTRNMGHSLQAVTKKGKKRTIWPADTSPLMVLYLKEQVKDYLDMQVARSGSPLQRELSESLDDEQLDRIFNLLDGHPELANSRSAGGRTPLTLAASRGSIPLAKMLLGKGAEVNMADRREHRTALHYACQKGTMEMVDLLLSHKAEIKPVDREKATPLYLAKSEGHDGLVKKLASMGAKERVTYHTAEPGFPWGTLWPVALAPLVIFTVVFCLDAGNVHTAAATGNLRKVKSLVEANPKLLDEPSEKFHETPLQEAASAGRLEVVRYLVEKGARVHYGAAHGSSPLERAVSRGHKDVVIYLLEHTGAASDEARPLHAAAENGNLDLATLLLEKGFSFNQPDRNGRTPLHRAVESDSLDIVTLLIEKGAEVNAPSTGRENMGRTPLHYASSARAVRILARKGAHVNALDVKGLTPLHCAAEGSGSAVEELLAHGAHVNARDNAGKTPLTYAKNYRYSRQVILEHGGKE